jgi:acetylornithine deacetylase/succinyl-diaminopimelate desuccinylase-like protein
MRPLQRRRTRPLISGFSLPDANAHAPNERLRIEYIPSGIETATRYLSTSDICDGWASFGIAQRA